MLLGEGTGVFSVDITLASFKSFNFEGRHDSLFKIKIVGRTSEPESSLKSYV